MTRKVGSRWTENARKAWIEYRQKRFNNNNIENSSPTLYDKRVPERESGRICSAKLSSMRKVDENA